MAAPVATLPVTYGFRDSKGQVAHMRVIVGAATVAAVYTNIVALGTLIAAVTNASVFNNLDANQADKESYGTTATYPDIEDKMVLTYKDAIGHLHRYQVPCPKSAEFLTDGETVDQAETNMAALNTAFNTYVYGFFNDTAPLTYLGGTRVRRKLQRRFNIFTRNPALSGPGL